MTFISFKFLIDNPSKFEKKFFKEFAFDFDFDFDWKSKEREVLQLLDHKVFLSREAIEKFVSLNF